MLDQFIQLLFFSAKAIIIVAIILLLLAGIIALLSAGKEKLRNKISVTNLNQKYREMTETLQQEILPKDEFKKIQKQHKSLLKNKPSTEQKNIYVINFHGDIKASAVTALREEVTAILNVATPKDEVVVRLESAGGMVHAYGLAAAQLLRLRQKNIPLTVIVDKVAASGGYMMACIGNKILAAPFAIIGSIGVLIQIPNFHRLLQEKNIDFEQLTAGNYKRTLTLFGENTEEGREKLQEEINAIHTYFKQLIVKNRPQVAIDNVATGEHWIGEQALTLNLVDTITTSDDYLLTKSKEAAIYEICYTVKKSFLEKFFGNSSSLKNSHFLPYSY